MTLTMFRCKDLRFYFSVFSLGLVSIEKIYHTLKTMFEHISKLLKVHQNTPLHVIFSTLFLVFGNVVRHGLLCSIYHWKNQVHHWASHHEFLKTFMQLALYGFFIKQPTLRYIDANQDIITYRKAFQFYSFHFFTILVLFPLSTDIANLRY